MPPSPPTPASSPRALQEWACLLAQELPFATAARPLGWQAGEDGLLSPTTLRRLVRRHGALIRAAEHQDAEGGPDERAPMPLVPHPANRRRARWPDGLTAAVKAALAHQHPCPPRGIAWADWARVPDARRADATRSPAELRRLGPELEEGQVLVMIDEVLARACGRRQFVEVRTARVATVHGYRYITGLGAAFLRQLRRLLLGLAAPGQAVLGLADCARWIRAFFAEDLAPLPDRALLLAWHHLRVRCAEEASRACRGRVARVAFLRRLLRRLWRGEVIAALGAIEREVPRARSGATLATFASYIWARRRYIPSYRDRWRALRYIGSGQLEEANDLLVARRQKGRGMHWSAATSDALAALRTLQLNDEWDRYWQRESPACSLAAAA